ncbi:MAG TPA: hypothetical protein VLV87_10635 [Gammaproteobacteria bacterium]|nr:hypothetical protein [Gammaproteobacteria bacterium]
MSAANSSAIDEILSKSEDNDDYTPEGRPGRKPGSAKPPQPRPSARNNQAWRAIEDMKESRRLDRNLKEVYEEEE